MEEIYINTLSLCMIVKNEEDVIGRCLECVSDIFDEIIVVDTGSEDKTRDIVKKYTKNLYYFKWIEDFAAARNYAFSKATKDYIMWLDADDIILDKDKEKIKELKMNMDKSIDMVMMKYNTSFDSDGNVTFSYYRERIFKRSKKFRWIGEIHEVIPLEGNIIYSDAAISHKKLKNNDPKRNLRIFENMIANGNELDPRQQFYYARELYYNKRYEDAINTFNNFLDSGKGWVENCINACQDLSYCYYAISESKKALNACFRSFEFDEPRAEICCDIGKYFLDREQYNQAIFWYELALTRKINESSGGFILLDCYNFIPYIQLCLCYFRIGDIKKSKEYNDKAASIKPNDPAVIYNNEYFDSIEK